ncbi:hypothetical protein [Streptomyces sp. C10-9-1]|uniref:hypothetical protein n=1 Tax=Streptomyces sp. C10-9-1 TaxID=1859285 RepID=UPI003F4A65E3
MTTIDPTEPDPVVRADDYYRHDLAFVGRGLPREVFLEAEIRRLRALLHRQQQLLDDYQAANERMYRQDYDRSGGPRFHQPAAEEPPRALGTLPPPRPWSWFTPRNRP